MNRRIFIRQPFTYFWVISNFLFLFFDKKNWFDKSGIDSTVVLAGNFILFIVTLLSFLIYQRSLKATSATASVRGMYGSFMIKFFACLIAAFVYIMVAKKDVNKPALIICMGLYIVYTIMEVAALQKLLKQKNKDKFLNK